MIEVKRILKCKQLKLCLDIKLHWQKNSRVDLTIWLLLKWKPTLFFGNKSWRLWDKRVIVFAPAVQFLRLVSPVF